MDNIPPPVAAPAVVEVVAEVFVIVVAPVEDVIAVLLLVNCFKLDNRVFGERLCPLFSIKIIIIALMKDII